MPSINNNPQNNNNNQSTDSNRIMQQEERQIINNSQDQVHKNSMLFRMGQYQYQLKGDEDPNHPTTFIGKLRKKFAPTREKIAEHKLMHEPSARRRRKVMYSSFGGLLLFFGLLGLFMTNRSLLIANTPIGQVKHFVNGDPIQVTNMKYYPEKHTALFYISTGDQTSQSTGISANNLKTSFQFSNPPTNSNLPAPTMQLLPLYQNHYVIALRNVYSSFKSLSIRLKDTNAINYNNISRNITQDNGNESIGTPNIGADIMTKKQVKLLSMPQVQLNASQTAEQDRIMKWVHTHNYQFLIFGHHMFIKHSYPGGISSHLTGNQLLTQLFKTNIKHSKQDLRVKNQKIQQDKKILQSDIKKLQDLHKDSSITNSDPQITDATNNIKTDRQQIANNQLAAKDDQKAINQAENNLSQALNGIIKPNEQGEDTSQPWNNGSGGK